nr:MAG: hypothetical protein [Apis mellifra filamentous-like virus]
MKRQGTNAIAATTSTSWSFVDEHEHRLCTPLVVTLFSWDRLKKVARRTIGKDGGCSNEETLLLVPAKVRSSSDDSDSESDDEDEEDDLLLRRSNNAADTLVLPQYRETAIKQLVDYLCEAADFRLSRAAVLSDDGQTVRPKATAMALLVWGSLRVRAEPKTVNTFDVLYQLSRDLEKHLNNMSLDGGGVGAGGKIDDTIRRGVAIIATLQIRSLTQVLHNFRLRVTAVRRTNDLEWSNEESAAIAQARLAQEEIADKLRQYMAQIDSIDKMINDARKCVLDISQAMLRHYRDIYMNTSITLEQLMFAKIGALHGLPRMLRNRLEIETYATDLLQAMETTRQYNVNSLKRIERYYNKAVNALLLDAAQGTEAVADQLVSKSMSDTEEDGESVTDIAINLLSDLIQTRVHYRKRMYDQAPRDIRRMVFRFDQFIRRRLRERGEGLEGAWKITSRNVVRQTYDAKQRMRALDDIVVDIIEQRRVAIGQIEDEQLNDLFGRLEYTKQRELMIRPLGRSVVSLRNGQNLFQLEYLQQAIMNEVKSIMREKRESDNSRLQSAIAPVDDELGSNRNDLLVDEFILDNLEKTTDRNFQETSSLWSDFRGWPFIGADPFGLTMIAAALANVDTSEQMRRIKNVVSMYSFVLSWKIEQTMAIFKNEATTQETIMTEEQLQELDNGLEETLDYEFEFAELRQLMRRRTNVGTPPSQTQVAAPENVEADDIPVAEDTKGTKRSREEEEEDDDNVIVTKRKRVEERRLKRRREEGEDEEMETKRAKKFIDPNDDMIEMYDEEEEEIDDDGDVIMNMNQDFDEELRSIKEDSHELFDEDNDTSFIKRKIPNTVSGGRVQKRKRMMNRYMHMPVYKSRKENSLRSIYRPETIMDIGQIADMIKSEQVKTSGTLKSIKNSGDRLRDFLRRKVKIEE